MMSDKVVDGAQQAPPTCNPSNLPRLFESPPYQTDDRGTLITGPSPNGQGSVALGSPALTSGDGCTRVWPFYSEEVDRVGLESRITRADDLDHCHITGIDSAYVDVTGGVLSDTCAADNRKRIVIATCHSNSFYTPESPTQSDLYPNFRRYERARAQSEYLYRSYHPQDLSWAAQQGLHALASVALDDANSRWYTATTSHSSDTRNVAFTVPGSASYQTSGHDTAN